MGRYDLEPSKTILLRPVYKSSEGAYIFFSRELYFIQDITRFVIRFIIAAVGSWLVGFDPEDTTITGWIKSENTGLLTKLTIPTSGWRYVDGGKFVGRDDTLKFIYN